MTHKFDEDDRNILHILGFLLAIILTFAFGSILFFFGWLSCYIWLLGMMAISE